MSYQTVEALENALAKLKDAQAFSSIHTFNGVEQRQNRYEEIRTSYRWQAFASIITGVASLAFSGIGAFGKESTAKLFSGLSDTSKMINNVTQTLEQGKREGSLQLEAKRADSEHSENQERTRKNMEQQMQIARRIDDLLREIRDIRSQANTTVQR